MELSAFLIYLIGTVDSFNRSLDFLVFLLFIGIFVFGFVLCMTYGSYSMFEETKEGRAKKETMLKWCKRGLISCSILWVILGSITILIPSSKTIIAMITVPAIVNNEEVQKLPKNVISFVNKYLETEIYRYKNQRKEDDL